MNENPAGCAVVVAGVVTLPNENSGFVVVVVVLEVVVVVGDPKLNPDPVAFELPNIFCKKPQKFRYFEKIEKTPEINPPPRANPLLGKETCCGLSANRILPFLIF